MSTSTLAVPSNKNPCTPLPMEQPGSRIRERRKELGLSQSELARKAGITYQAIQQVEAGGGSKHLVPIAIALGVSAEWLQAGEGPKAPAPQPNKHAFSEASTDRIPVRGMAECGDDGWALWNGDIVDHVPRPPMLSGAPHAYAVFVVGESMEPRYHPGELAYIHPGKPVGPGDYVLVQAKPRAEGDPPRAFLKRLVRRSGSKTVLSQYKPEKTFELRQDQIISIHKVVGSGAA